MLSAAIDVGSNTIRLIIGDNRSGRFCRIHSDRVITRLAETIGKTGNLSERAITESLSALKGFSQTISRYGHMPVRAVGTSALREAKNTPEFLQDVLLETGISIEVISGEKEAELTVRGVLLDPREESGTSLIIDIGGGSTEWILNIPGCHDRPLHASLPIGVVKLSEECITDDPPSDQDISSLSGRISEAVCPFSEKISAATESPKVLIGTGGTMTTLAAIDLGFASYMPEKIHHHTIPLQRLSAMKDLLLSLPLAARERVRGLEPERADLIIPGILLTMIIMKNFGFRELLVSDYGLLEGLLQEMCYESGL